jgi:enhancer of polycomb-like protein
MVSNGRMVTSSRRAGRVTNKTKLLIYRGSDKVDLAHAEVILWTDGDGESAPKNQHVGAKGVESGEMLVSCFLAFIFYYA